MERRAGGYRREKHDVRNAESLGSYILRLLVTLVPHLQHASPLHDPLVTSLRSVPRRKGSCSVRHSSLVPHSCLRRVWLEERMSVVKERLTITGGKGVSVERVE